MKRWPWPLKPRKDSWPSVWLSSRACICPLREQLNQVVEADGACHRCGGRVVRSVPFNPGEWGSS